ncbi:hypothetical protein WJX84_008516 [Apatococcus fuscideae]|uniref:Uncharacterized protein n=1 Tax=Apatococcus fuscideae TaxID=2026836 RepID=A0AAW1T0B7_9CHLO
MGALMSCCGGSKGDSSQESYARFGSTTASQTSVPPTERDVQAQNAAAEAAERRQQKFDESATGRAARTAVNNVKKEREADRVDRNDRAKDWLN